MIKKFGVKSPLDPPAVQKVKEKKKSANQSPEAAKQSADDAQEKEDQNQEKKKGKVYSSIVYRIA